MENGKDSMASVLQEILTSINGLKDQHVELASAVDAITGRVNVLAGVKQIQAAKPSTVSSSHSNGTKDLSTVEEESKESMKDLQPSPEPMLRKNSTSSSKIILTSYPGQSGLDPIPMDWGNPDPNIRGPVVVSRLANTIRRRNGESSAT